MPPEGSASARTAAWERVGGERWVWWGEEGLAAAMPVAMLPSPATGVCIDIGRARLSVPVRRPPCSTVIGWRLVFGCGRPVATTGTRISPPRLSPEAAPKVTFASGAAEALMVLIARRDSASFRLALV